MSSEQSDHDVRCSFCRRTYSLGHVEVTARYADCSVWVTPCCGRQADDRGETGWKSYKDYTYLRDEGHRGVGPVGRMLIVDRDGNRWEGGWC